VGEISANFRPSRPTHSETAELSLARTSQKHSGDLNPDVSRVGPKKLVENSPDASRKFLMISATHGR
jgi:hypothetical protein